MNGLDLLPNPTEGRPLLYLACPYSHGREEVMQRRYEAANAATAALMREGRNVFSPITHSHVLAQDHDLPNSWSFWEDVDKDYLRISYALVVLQISGWEESTGVTAERGIARKQGIPTFFAHGADLSLSETAHERTPRLVIPI